MTSPLNPSGHRELIATCSYSGSIGDDGQSVGTPSVTIIPRCQNDKMPNCKLSTGDSTALDENTPLLGKGGDPCTEGVWRATVEETWAVLQYAIPVICTTLLEYSFNVVSVIVIGHLSTKMLAGATLASLTIGVTGNSIIYGFAGALDSLLPQAWTSEHPSHVGLWTQRMMVLVSVILVPIVALWQNFEPILLHLRQDPEVARLAALYLKFASLELPGYAFNTIFRRYLQAQGLLRAPSLITIFVAPINIALNYLLVWGPEPIRLGFIGAPIASAISVNLMAVLYAVYGFYFAPQTAWCPITSQSFACLPKLFGMGAIGVGQSAAEWWSMEFMSLAASQLGPTALAAQSVVVVVSATTYVVQYSLGIAAAVRTGNLLGSGDARQAHLSSRAAIILALVGGITFGGTLFALRHKITYLFIDDQDVRYLVSTVMPIISLYQIVDGIAAVEAGILRACGRLGAAAILNFAAYYIIGLPLGIYLAFWHKLGLAGLWTGFALGLFWAAAMIWITVLRLDWGVQVREAKERLESGDSSVSEHVHP